MKFSENLLLNDVGLLGNVDTIKELSDILVSDSAGLLDVSTGLRDVLDGVTDDADLILLVGRDLSAAALVDGDFSDSLLTEEVSDLNDGTVLNEVDVDGEMGVDVSHLVLVTSGDTGDHVVDEGLDGSQSSDVLSVTIEDGDLDLVIGDLLEGNVDVRQVLLEGTSGPVTVIRRALMSTVTPSGISSRTSDWMNFIVLAWRVLEKLSYSKELLSLGEKATIECWDNK